MVKDDGWRGDSELKYEWSWGPAVSVSIENLKCKFSGPTQDPSETEFAC